MGLNLMKTKFSYLSKDPFLRCDVDYVDISKKIFKEKNFRILKDYIISLETGQSIKRTDYNDGTSKYAHLVVRNIKKGKLDLNNLIYLKENKGKNLSQYKLEKGDLIIAISSNVGAACYFNSDVEDIQLTLSHYLTKLKINEDKIDPYLLVFYINSKLLQSYFRSVETGKTIKNLSKYYIRTLPIIIPKDINVQKEISKLIKPLDLRIEYLNSELKDFSEIINQVFEEEFNLDNTKLNEYKSESKYKIQFSEFSNNKDLRFSYKFHNNAGKFVQSTLEGISSSKIKDFLAEPIKLGKGISPKEYDINGDYYYLTMACIKNWKFETENAKKVSVEFSSKNKNKNIHKNDIIMARSGEGTIGKVALIEDHSKAIFADFTMNIRLKNYNFLFAYYFFRSEFFQYLIYVHKKGLGNNTNIFPSQIQEFLIPDISLKEQERIINKIRSELDRQKSLKDEIEANLDKIDEIISEAIEI